MKTENLSFRRILAVIVAFSIILGPIAAQPVFGASGKTRLVSSVMQYSYSKGKWVREKKTSFEYAKGYPKSITTYNYDSKDRYRSTFKHTFRSNGKPETMEMFNDSGAKEQTYSYLKNGNVRTILYDCEGIVWKETFQYGAGRYFTIKIHEETRRDIVGNTKEEEYCDEIDYVAVTRKNGLLKKTVNRGIFANYDNVGTEKKWADFMGTYTAGYDKNGVIRSTRAKFTGNSSYLSGKQLKFTTRSKNGKITQVTRYMWNIDKKRWDPKNKYVFKYSKNKISKARYATMMNDILMEENNYYQYIWY